MVIISFIAGALVMFVGLFYGLKWKVSIEQGEPPKVELPKLPKLPQTQETNGLTRDIIQEWFEGKKEGET